jgi:uncharacterized protein (DUF2267 family)
MDVFDNTLQKTNIWLHEIMDELGTKDRHAAYAALRTTLHALRDRLTVAEAAHLGAQLPMLIRGLYYEGWRPAGKPHKADLGEFLDSIRKHYGSGFGTAAAREAAHAVFRVLDLHVSAGEIEDVKHCLPPELRELW